MIAERIIHSEIDEGDSLGTVAYIELPDGNAMQIADCSSWDVRVADLTDSNPHPDKQRTGQAVVIERRPYVYELLGVDPSVTNTNTGLPSTPLIISDTPRKDGYWKKAGSSLGYNVLHFITPAMQAAYSPVAWDMIGGHLYLARYVFQTTFGIAVIRHYATVRGLGPALGG